jgi:LEA14-like dessication related protein
MKPIILAIAAMSLLSATCNNSLQYPTYVKTEGTKLENLSLGGSSAMRTNLVFNNPNGFGISLKEADLKIYLEGNYVGDCEQPNQIDVKAKSNFSFPIVAKFNSMKMMSTALSLMSKKEIAYRIAGTIKAGKNGVFIKVPVSIEDKYLR